MSFPWNAEEDRILLECAKADVPDVDIASRLADMGFSRSATAVQCRRVEKYKIIYRKAAPEPPTPPIDIIPDYRMMDDRFCAALRLHHPDKETGPLRTSPMRLVPGRKMADPIFSSTGLMVLG